MLNNHIEELTKTANTINQELGIIEQQIDLQDKQNQLNSKFKPLEKDTKKINLFSMKNDLLHAQTSYNRLHEIYTSTTKEKNELYEENKNLTKKIYDLQNELKKISSELEDLKNNSLRQTNNKEENNQKQNYILMKNIKIEINNLTNKIIAALHKGDSKDNINKMNQELQNFKEKKLILLRNEDPRLCFHIKPAHSQLKYPEEQAKKITNEHKNNPEIISQQDNNNVSKQENNNQELKHANILIEKIKDYIEKQKTNSTSLQSDHKINTEEKKHLIKEVKDAKTKLKQELISAIEKEMEEKILEKLSQKFYEFNLQYIALTSKEDQATTSLLPKKILENFKQEVANNKINTNATG